MQIFHLEDDGPLREIMRITLAAAEPGIVIKQFINSDAAMDYLIENVHDIALFLLDIRVPGQYDGIEVAEKIRAIGSTRPIVITSAYRKPDKDMLDTLDCIWMAKPWHILDAPQTILPLAKQKDEVASPPVPAPSVPVVESSPPVAPSVVPVVESSPPAPTVPVVESSPPAPSVPVVESSPPAAAPSVPVVDSSPPAAAPSVPVVDSSPPETNQTDGQQDSDGTSTP